MQFSTTAVANMKRLHDEGYDADVQFLAKPSDTANTGAVHNPLTATFSTPTTIPDQGLAVLGAKKVASDGSQLGVGTRITNPIALRVEANGEFIPAVAMDFIYPYPGGQRYTVKEVKRIDRAGVTQAFRVVGSA